MRWKAWFLDKVTDYVKETSTNLRRMKRRELKMRAFKATTTILPVSGMVAQCSNIDLAIYKHKKRLAHTYSQS
jgi:hypothetical protein